MEKVTNAFSAIGNAIAKFLAKFYNSLHPKLKIALMVLVSFVISGFINLFIRDLTEYNATVANDYVKLVIDGLVPFLTVVFNLVQQWGVEAGTKILATQGDVKTIEKLEAKVVETKETINLRK